MDNKLTFEDLYEAYNLCLKNKKNKIGTYNFVNYNLCKNLMELLEELNNKQYIQRQSNCYVVKDPALREIYAAQFFDRVVQHFYMKEVEHILEEQLVDGCCSCRKNKGNDYALQLLKKYLKVVSNNGKKDCYFLKIDLSGYFMSIDRKQISQKFLNLISNKYKGPYKELLIYLTPIIFENNPAVNCKYKCNEKVRNLVPERRKMNPKSDYGMAIGNLTSQAGSNFNLSEFDNYVVYKLNLVNYIRYVDDMVIISNNKQELQNAMPYIINKLKETNQSISEKKTKIDTAYHGVPFLGKVSFPYGYQKAKKSTIVRVYKRGREIRYKDTDNLLAKTNSQIGLLKGYNCRKLILNYSKIIQNKTGDEIYLNEEMLKFCKKNK